MMKAANACAFHNGQVCIFEDDDILKFDNELSASFESNKVDEWFSGCLGFDEDQESLDMGSSTSRSLLSVGKSKKGVVSSESN